MKKRAIIVLCLALVLTLIGCGNKDVNRRNTFDQARIGTLGIKPKYITEIFVDKENADMALHIVHTLK